MSNPIVTTWSGAAQPTSTNWSTGQSIQQWIDAHIARATSNMQTDPPESAGPITTTWTSAAGAKSVSTNQNQGESVEDWIDRHFAAVRALMETFPPIDE